MRFATFRERTLEERAAEATQLERIAAAERVLLDTCHRVELITVADTAPRTPETLDGREAVRRVFEVVGGFHSAVVAEEQLLGQARAAYEAALAAGTTGPILNELFRRALRFGRRVRSHARPGADRSLADRGTAWLIDRLGPERAAVLVAGTGEMGRLVAIRLAQVGHRLTIASRSGDRGGRLLDQLPGDRHRLVVGDLGAVSVAAHGAVVLAVRTREPVLAAAHLGDAAASLPWVVDLSTPTAVSPEATARLGSRLVDIDALGRIGSEAPVLTAGVERRLRRELDEAVAGFVTWMEARRSAHAISLLHGGADAVRRRHLDRLRRRSNLEPDQLAAVEAASAAMLGELLHGPSVELRRGGADAATVRRLFGLDA